MYIFLIEAGGLRQMARVHRSWYQRFFHDLDEVLHRYAFSRTRAEGDLIIGACSVSGDEIDAQLIVDAMRSILTFLRAHSENLLDFVVIFEYLRTGDHVAGERELERYLRRVREADSLYITETVFAALAPMVEAESARGLYRLTRFCEDHRSAMPPYREVLCDEEELHRFQEALQARPGAHAFWVRASDRSVTTATVQAALEQDGIAPVTVQCRPGMTRAEFERRVLQALPDVPAYSASGTEEEFEQALLILRDRLRDPAGKYLSSGWIADDLRLITSRSVERFLQSDSRRRLFIADYDLCGPDAPDLWAWIPEAITTGPLVVSAAADPPDERWEPVTLSTPPVSTGSWQEAFRYWSEFTAEASSDGADPKIDASLAGRHLSEALSVKHGRVLFVLTRTEDLVSPILLDAFFQRISIIPVEFSRMLADLHHLGLVTSLDPLSVHPATNEFLGWVVPREEQESLSRELAQYVIEVCESGVLHPTLPLWTLLENAPATARRRWFFHRMIHGLAVGGSFSGFDRVDKVRHDPRRRHGPDSDAIAVPSARIRLYLRDSQGPEHLDEDARNLMELVSDEETIDREIVDYSGDYYLSLSEYHLANRDYAAALTYCKRAALLNQQEAGTFVHGRGAAHLLMARIALSQRRMNEVSQYLAFAREDARDDPATLLIARMLEAIRFFLRGNLTSATTELTDLVPQLLDAGFTEWLLLAWFTMARTRFELGEYDHAQAQFSLVRRYCEGNGRTVPARVAAAWAMRSDLQSAPGDRTLREHLAAMDSEPEAVFFLAEAHCRSGEFERALPLLEQACTLESAQNRWPRLGVCWDNGFASIEDLIIAFDAETSELLRIATAYRAWSLSETGRIDDAVPLFYDLTRGNGGISDDPYAGLYNFLYASVLPRERSPDRDDAVTVLGKAVKLLQERTSRIEDYRDKKKFLQENVWNRRLMDTARRYNLV